MAAPFLKQDCFFAALKDNFLFRIYKEV